MAQEVKIILTGDARDLINALKKSDTALSKFTTTAEGTGSTVSRTKKSSKGLGAGLSALAGPAAIAGAAILAGGAAMASYTKEAVVAAATQERLERSTRALAASYSETSSEIISAITTASFSTISQSEAMMIANRAMIAEVATSPEKFAELTAAAATLGQALGLTTTEAMTRLTEGIAKQEVELLDELGIVIRAGEVWSQYAKDIGVSTLALTAEQKATSFSNEVTRLAIEQAERLGGLTVTNATHFEQLSTSTKDLSASFGEWFTNSTPVLGITDALTDSMMGLAGVFEFGIGPIFGNFEAVDALRAEEEALIETQSDLTEELGQTAEEFEAQVEAQKNLTLATADWTASSTELTEKHRDKQREISQDIVGIHERANQDRADNNDKLNEGLQKAEKKKDEAMASLARKASKLTDDEYSFRSAKIIRTFEESKAATIEGHKDTNAEIKAGLAEQSRILEEQRVKEKADFEAHILELKTKTSLGLLESTGELSTLTGGLTDNAEEAFNLIKAGIIPVEGELAAFLSGAHKDLTKNADEFRAQAEENTRALEQAFSKQTQAIDKETDAAKRLEDQAKRTASAMASITNGSSGGSRVPGFAQGGSFTVPPGFPNDSFMMGVSSGEGVNVSPVTNNNFTFNTNSPAETRQNFHMARAMS